MCSGPRVASPGPGVKVRVSPQSPEKRLTFLCPGDPLLGGVHVVFEHRLQDCGSGTDFLGANGMAFLGGWQRITGEAESGIMKQLIIDLITVKPHGNHSGAKRVILPILLGKKGSYEDVKVKVRMAARGAHRGQLFIYALTCISF